MRLFKSDDIIKISSIILFQVNFLYIAILMGTIYSISLLYIRNKSSSDFLI